MTAAISTLDGTLVASAHEEWDSGSRPSETLQVLDQMFTRLSRRTQTEPWAFGIGIAGPVDFAAGTLVAPPIMPGWDGYNIRAWFRERYDAPVWVDNDVNVMALGEWHKGEPRNGRDLLYILVDTGIGAGLVTAGNVFRGHHGAAGDVGHIRVTDDETVVCRCGRTGCLEAVTGGWGLIQRLTPLADGSARLSAKLKQNGHLTAQDIGDAAAAGDQVAQPAVLDGARLVGETVANVVSFANPGTVVLGGGAIRVGAPVFEAFERAVRGRVTGLAGRDLQIRTASLDFQEGVTGAALLAIEQLFGAGTVGLWIENGSPVGRAALLHRAEIA